MPTVPSSSAKSAALEKYMSCPECGADFDRLCIGGQGTWRTKIVCEDCFHIQRGLSHEQVIIPLVARQYNISRKAAGEVEEELQRDYERILADTEEAFKPDG